MLKCKRYFAFLIIVSFVIAMAPLSLAGEVEKININTASVEELTKLDRIGPKYAERIVQFREINGPFEKPEDIIKVKGIGPKTLEANIDKIAVE
jgi:competence protein ComEA